MSLSDQNMVGRILLCRLSMRFKIIYKDKKGEYIDCREFNFQILICIRFPVKYQRLFLRPKLCYFLLILKNILTLNILM